MSEKLYSYDKGNNKVLCNLNDVCDFNVTNVFRLLNSLADENEQLRNFIELMNMRQKWKLYNYKRDNDEREAML